MKRAIHLFAALAVCFTALIVFDMRANGDAPSEFIASYDGNVPAQAHVAIDAAMASWAANLSTEVPVVVKIEWDSLPAYVAGGSEPLGFAVDPQTGFQIPIALANARAGVDLDPSKDDIRLVLSNRENWNYDPGRPAAAGETDLMSFTLHEVGHGIGFYSSSHKQGGVVVFGGGSNGEGVPGPTLLDGMLMTSVGTMLVDQHPVANIVTNLRTTLNGNDVVWAGNARDSSGNRPKMSSGLFEPHTSLMHLDEDTYAPGNPDAMLTPMIRRGETSRNLGPAILGIMRDLGWTVSTAGGSSSNPQQQSATARVPKAAAATAPSNSAAQPEAVTPTTVAATPETEVKGTQTNRSATAKTSSGGSSSASPVGIIIAALVLAAIAWRVITKVRAISEFLDAVGLGGLTNIRFRPFQQFAGIND